MFKSKFNPMFFLMSLGSGGLSVSFFVYLQYMSENNIKEGLVNASTYAGTQDIFIKFAEFGMVLFSLIHAFSMAYLIYKLVIWIKNGNAKEMIKNPLTNSSLMAPILAVGMSFNVFVGVLRYFVPAIYKNFQDFMQPAFIAWAILWVIAIWLQIKILKNSFVTGFDVSKINFGWLLQPFALGMVSTVGSGIAALSKDSQIAGAAAFMSLVSISFALFLFTVKLNSLFKRHLDADKLPSNKFIPSFLVVIPNLTIFSIVFYRLGKYLEFNHGYSMEELTSIINVFVFAFQTWYILFGLALMADYIKKSFFKEFQVTQWGLVCPFLSYSITGAFFYSMLAEGSMTLKTIVMTSLLITILLFFVILYKQLACATKSKNKKFECIEG